MADRPKAVITIGASAGGVQALSALLAELPEDLAAAVFVVLHIPPHTPSEFPEVLQRATRLTVAAAKDGERVRAGRVYVAPADRHLMIYRESVRVTRGPKESRVRPSIDVLFRSAAIAFGPRVIGVVLTGMLDDGTAGLWAVKDRGGKTLVQDPATAEYSSMPESAIAHVAVDGVMPVSELAKEILRLTQEAPVMEDKPAPEGMRIESTIANEANSLAAGVMTLGKVSGYTCPDCHGVLVQIEEGSIVRFRCHTGHAFSLKSLLAEVNQSIDNGLWDTMRAIEERIMLLRQMAEIASRAGDTGAASKCEAQASDAEKRVQPIRELVLDPAFFGHGPEDH
jgi:two-component system chemotaxis response regulator CheB